MFSHRPVFTASLAILVVLFPSASVVVAQPQQEDDENATTPPLMSDDPTTTDLSSLLMTNYNALLEEGQGFFLLGKTNLYEKPGSVPTSIVAVHWWCDLEFASEDADNKKYGYVGRAIEYFLGSSLEDIVAQGGEIAPQQKRPFSGSAVLVPTLGIFEGQIHATHDDFVVRYWDDGSSTLPVVGWEGHDEGDAHPDSETSAFSSYGTLAKITTEAAAALLGMEIVDMTTATCSTEYEAAWNATHVPDPIDTSVTDLEETVAQLQADNKELMSRIVAIEGSITANGSGSGDDGEATATSSSSPFMASYEHDTMNIMMKSCMTVAVIIGLVLFL